MALTSAYAPSGATKHRKWTLSRHEEPATRGKPSLSSSGSMPFAVLPFLRLRCLPRRPVLPHPFSNGLLLRGGHRLSPTTLAGSGISGFRGVPIVGVGDR